MEPLRKTENDIADITSAAKKHVRIQSENYQLENTGAEQQQFRTATAEDIAYNAIDRRTTYYKTESAYNENRITEKAFNDRADDSVSERVDSTGSSPSSPQLPSDNISNMPQISISDSEPEAGYNRYVINITDKSFGLWKNAADISESEEKIEELDKKIREKYIQRFYITKGDSKKKRLLFNYYGNTRLTGHMEYKEILKAGKLGVQISRDKINRNDYEKIMQKADRKAFERRAAGRLMFRKGVSLANDESISEDENIADFRRAGKRAVRGTAMLARKSVKTLKRNNNIYARYELEEMRNRALKSEHKRLMSKYEKSVRKQQLREAASKEQKKKLKKKMVQQRAMEEGNFFTRTKSQLAIKKSSRKYQQLRQKRFLASLAATFVLVVLAIILVMALFLGIIAVTQGGTELYASSVTQNDYATLTVATTYLTKLEADLDEYLNVERELLEAELEEEYGPEIYEYIYDLASFGFSANSLMAYLSAVHGSFTFSDIQSELDSIFDEMYHLEITVKLEDREIREYNPATHEYETVIVKKKICYVTLEKTELEEVIEARLPSELKAQYEAYWLSSGGQQVYAPVMREDWTNRISSNYGERIHPISGERKFHKGVDIAVPQGTKLYSAVKGTVIKSNYSDSAGNQVTVQTESGWAVTFMHMSSRAVTVGQKVEQGDFLGLSGNTGNSTGPHLHLQVEDANNNTINPVFIIPQRCTILSD